MSLLLVPYTNAMRLGQGFNSYTQQICVDDAVVVNNDRAENTLLNDGTTMRILIQSQAKASAWTRQKEVVIDDRTIGLRKEPLQLLPEEELEAALDEGGIDDADWALREGDGSSPNDDKAVSNGDEPILENDDPDRKDTTDVRQEGTASVEEDVAATEESTSPIIVEATPTEETTADDPGEGVKESDITTQDPEPSPKESAKAPASKGRVRSSSVGAHNAAHSKGSDEPGKCKVVAPVAVPTKKPTSLTIHRSKPTGWRKLQDSLAARKAAQVKASEEDREELRRAEKERLEEQRKYQEEVERETRAEDRIRRAEDRAEQRKIREEKRQFEEERRAEMLKSIKEAASSKSKALTMDEMKAVLKQNQFAERWNGMGENTQDWVFDANSPRGPSQAVTYNSRFVDRLSDITDDMCISGALSIKAAKIGGSGRGSFIDSDKFKNSDLTFYISVKVVNQTINFKDALEYKPLRGVNKENFTKVYGDSFISGFLEGGEFNAVVSMKILNKAKKTDIQAEAKVAFTAGPMSVEAEANVGIARENIESNTETTIQVSWCGGGHIKPLEQQWDIKSLMQAAARFPDLVAECPQRTYAILTKYENLRSFIIRQPAAYSKLQYENAQIYTNVLMDCFMSYKALYKKLSDQIFQIGQRTMEIIPWDKVDAPDGTEKPSKLDAPSQALQSTKRDEFDPLVDDKSRFHATVAGLDEARKVIRRQMLRIVNEVDAIEEDPNLATDEDHKEPFQSPTSLEARLPVVEIPERLRPKQIPLNGRRIIAKAQSEEKRLRELEAQEGAKPLYAETEAMEPNEVAEFAKFIDLDPSIGEHLEVTTAVGGTDDPPFNNLDFVREDWQIKLIEAKVGEGVLRAMKVEYDNGLIVQKGSTAPGNLFQLTSFGPRERITSCMIETGIWISSTKRLVLGIRLYTNRGRTMFAEAMESKPTGDRSAIKDGYEYTDISFTTFDCPLKGGTLKGFYGRSGKGSVSRVGLIWGDVLGEASSTSTISLKADRRILTSRCGQTFTQDLVTHKARFGITYPVAPRVLFAISEVRGLQTSPRPPSWDLFGSTDITTSGFTVKISLQEHWLGLVDLSHSWLTLPNNEVNFNIGSHDFEKEIEDAAESGAGTFQVIFEKPYKLIPATPAIWCMTLDYSGGPTAKPDARLRARVEDLTITGFKLVVESWDGGKHAGNVWGWCVWDKEYDGVKVKTGTTSFSNAEATTKGNLKSWKPDFGGKTPVSIMTGIRGLDINVSDGGRFHAKSQYQGGLDNDSIVYGVDATSSARWMEAMYVAILQN